MSTQKDNEGHRQRLRDKFLKNGLDGFLDYEIIELLLTLGTPRSDCKQSARDALKKFGSLKSVLEATPVELKEIKGIGENNVFGLKIAQAVSRRPPYAPPAPSWLLTADTQRRRAHRASPRDQ